MEQLMLFAMGCLTAMLLQTICVRSIKWMLQPKKMKHLLILPLSGECEELESLLRWQFFRMDNDLLQREMLLLITDCGLCFDARKRAERFCENRKNCRICERSELENILRQHSICKEIEVVLY